MRIGIELGHDAVRAVALPGRRAQPLRTIEVPWSAEHPADAVSALQTEFGAVSSIAIAVGLGLLHVKHVDLPPIAPELKRKLVLLEPDRFFAVRNEALAVAIADTHNVVFAASERLVGKWLDAFGAWGKIAAIEPAPLALARLLGHDGAGTYAVPASAEDNGVIEIEAGVLVRARRIPAPQVAPAAGALPARAGVPAEFLTAFAVAQRPATGLHELLFSQEQARRFQRTRAGRIAALALGCTAAIIFALWSVDHARERALTTIIKETAAVESRAARAIQLRTQLAGLKHEATLLRAAHTNRADPIRVLGALSRTLPPDAVILNLRAAGAAWQIDGTARNAAQIVPILDRDEQFDNVRFLSASSRYREANRTYETFSIAFDVR